MMTDSGLGQVIASASGCLIKTQRPDGHWVFELEADCTIPAEYVLLLHFLDEPNPAVEARIGTYLRACQGEHGGWPLFHDGDLDISASVKAYYALKIIGDDPNAPHMRRCREAILARGGAARANVFTRYMLALFGQVPWRAVPVMLVEMLLFPRWFPISLGKVSYWSRTVIVPLLVLAGLKPVARNPTGHGVAELFVVPPERERRYNTNPTGSFWGEVLLIGNWCAYWLDRFMPPQIRRLAIRRGLAFIKERLNGEDGLGAIYPAMANVVMTYHCLGYPPDHPDMAIARKAVEKLLVERPDGSVYCQPCVSPIWDTGLTALALLEAGEAPDGETMRRSMAWLRARQVLDVVGDWADGMDNPPRPGGWAFQYANPHYPDVDDTAVVAMALHRTGDPAHEEAIARAAEWIIGMQSTNGGWGAFDANNTAYHLNHIPFADHGALLDPPTVDVTARCVGFLAQIGYGRDHPVIDRAVRYLIAEQEADGSWFGRWGANYIYGTWSALCALNAVGFGPEDEPVRRAVEFLLNRQRADGGWGEDLASYLPDQRDACKASTPSQTAWALLGLMAAGAMDHDATERGIAWLESTPRQGARWHEEYYTGVGFPRVFYLRYHGYAAYFPLWALARYRSLMERNDRRVGWGL